MSTRRLAAAGLITASLFIAVLTAGCRVETKTVTLPRVTPNSAPLPPPPVTQQAPPPSPVASPAKDDTAAVGEYLTWLGTIEASRMQFEQQAAEQMRQIVEAAVAASASGNNPPTNTHAAVLAKLQEISQGYTSAATSFRQHQPPAPCAALADAYGKMLDAGASALSSVATQAQQGGGDLAQQQAQLQAQSLTLTQQVRTELAQIRQRYPNLPASATGWNMPAM